MLINELESSIKQYKVIKDYLSGAELSFENMREKLQSFKDSLSKIRLYLSVYFMRQQGSPVNISFEPIMNAINLALVMMESNPSNARQIFQMSLTISSIKIEDLMAFLSLIRDGM